MNWTHVNVKITDIRKLAEFYIFTIDEQRGTLNPKELVDYPLMVKHKIFEERLKTYFLKDPSRVTREEILEVRWNMLIKKGFYVKIHSPGMYDTFNQDPEKYYVSYLEIAGILGGIQSVYKEK